MPRLQLISFIALNHSHAHIYCQSPQENNKGGLPLSSWAYRHSGIAFDHETDKLSQNKLEQ